MTKQESERKASPGLSNKKPKTDESSPPASLNVATKVERNKAEINKHIQKYNKCFHPLVRFTCNTANTTAVERVNICKAAFFFMRRGPDTAPGEIPANFEGVSGLAFVGDPVNEPCEVRFSGAHQVANWITDAQARSYAAGVGVVRFTVELTSDNGSHWSAPLEVLH